MAARLSGRVRSLERRAGVRGQCARCKGLGTTGFEVLINGERDGPPSRGCPACGRLTVLYQLDITGGPEDDGSAASAPAGAAP